MPDDMEYISYVPARPPMDGRVIVHNRVRPVDFHPSYKPGLSGWRVWLSKPGWVSALGKPPALCECGWAPNAGDHYRVSGPEEAAVLDELEALFEEEDD